MAMGFETARPGRGFSFGSSGIEGDNSMRKTFHTTNNKPLAIKNRQNYDLASQCVPQNSTPVRPQLLTNNMIFPDAHFKAASTARHSSLPRSSVYQQRNSQRKMSIDAFEVSRQRRLHEKSLIATGASEIDGISADMQSTLTATASAKLNIKQRSNNHDHVVKKIMEGKDVNNRQMLMQMAHSGTDAELVARHVTLDNSLSNFMRKDGSMVKTQQSRGIASNQFAKHTFGKTITLKYDGTKFRPSYLQADSSIQSVIKLDESSQVLAPSDARMRSTLQSKSLLPSTTSKHHIHRTEQYHKPDSRAFLRDPGWSRDDIYASIRNFRENAPVGKEKLTLVQKQFLRSQKKADDTNRKLYLVSFFKQTHNLKLSQKLLQKMDTVQLEMAFVLALLDKKMHLAQISIAAIWKGIRTRRILRFLHMNRRWAIKKIQSFMTRRIRAKRLAFEQDKAAALVQRICKGHLVSKRYFRERAKISIDVTLESFFKIRNDWGTRLSNLVRFYWRVNRRVKVNKEAAEAKKKAAAKKGKKGKKGGSPLKSQMSQSMPPRRDSVKPASLSKTSTQKSGALKTMQEAASPSKEKPSISKTKVAVPDDSSPMSQEQERRSDLPAVLDSEKQKLSLQITMMPIEENDEDGLTRNIERGSVIELNARSDDADQQAAAAGEDTGQQSQTMLVVAPEISSWDIAEGASVLENDDEDIVAKEIPTKSGSQASSEAYDRQMMPINEVANSSETMKGLKSDAEQDNDDQQ